MKPHIYMRDGVWRCAARDEGFVIWPAAVGVSPTDAYNGWTWLLRKARLQQAGKWPA